MLNSQNDESSSTSSSKPTEEQRQIVEKCTKVIQEFRSGKITKPKASLLLQQFIPHDDLNENTFISSYESYFNMLDNFEHYRSGNLGRINDIQQLESSKTCLDFSALPWNEIENSKSSVDIESSTDLSPLASLQKTHILLENFSRDVKRAQSSLLNCNKSIPQFPQTEWFNLLSGNSIDLDHVFSNICTISHITSNLNVIELGKNVELPYESSAPAKTIKTHEDWVIAWNCTVDATLFAFKHRKQELQTYGKHIQRYFASLSPQFHSRVISYDRAVRIRAAQRRDIELSYFSEFTDLQLHWINNSPELTSDQLLDIGQD
jgi:hypothetical protein